MIELTGFRRDLLYVIIGHREPTGIDVRRAIEDYHDAEVVSARVYQNLDQLADIGVIEKRASGHRTNHYSITEAGEAVLRSRRRWENTYLDFDVPENAP